MQLSLDKTEIFCEILVQRPITRDTFHLPSRLTEKELEQIRIRAAEHFDLIMQVLKEMPRQLLLIIRYKADKVNEYTAKGSNSGFKVFASFLNRGPLYPWSC